MALKLNKAIIDHLMMANGNQEVHGIKPGTVVQIDDGFTALTTDIDTGEIMPMLAVNKQNQLYTRVVECVKHQGDIKLAENLNLKRVIVKVKLYAEVVEVYEEGSVMAKIVKGVKNIFDREKQIKLANRK
jgi:hypothetical protein